MSNNCAVGICSSPEHCIEVGRCFSAPTARIDMQLREDAARYRWLCVNRDVMLLTNFFGNGCVNRTIEEVHAAIDAGIRKTMNVGVGE